MNSHFFMFLSIISFCLAYLSWRYVEKPFRDREKMSRKKVLIFLGTLGFLLVFLGSVGYSKNGFEERFNIPNELVHSFSFHNLREKCDEKSSSMLDKDFCLIGEISSTTKVAVFGDSHSEALLPAFNKAAKEQGVGVVHLGLGGCPPLKGVYVKRGIYPEN